MPSNKREKCDRCNKVSGSGRTVARYTSDIMALKWRDKRDVAMLSTYHNDTKISIHSSCGDKEKPEAIFAYNEKMGGVDLADQQLTSYPYKANTSTI